MKILLLSLVFTLTSLTAQAAHWECNGAHILEKISFDLTSQIENLKISAPSIAQSRTELEQMFVQENAFTLVAFDLLDEQGQETVDYTLVLDRALGKITLFSQWSTNDHVDMEAIDCKITR